MFGVGAVCQALGLDPVAMFYAFIGSVCWQAMQPKLAPTFNAITTAFGWAVMSLLVGSLGAVGIKQFLIWKFEFTASIDHPVLIGFTALLLGFGCSAIVTKALSLIAEWKPK
jgi:hypothetical protein